MLALVCAWSASPGAGAASSTTAPAASTSTATSTAASPADSARSAGSGRSASSAGPSTASPAIEVGDAPLTDEDLALLAALDTRTATTSTLAAAPSRWWLAPAPLPRPTILLPRLRLREAIARSISEAFDSYPTIVDSSRRFVPGDSAIIRGQSGHRVALFVDGIPLHHALAKSRETAGGFTLDPWMLDEALVERPGVLSASPRGSAGSISLSSIEPLRRPGVEAEAEVEARSADRSTVSHAAAGAATEAAAARIALGYADQRPLRIATSKVGEDFGSGYQRLAATARARFFGRTGDPIRIFAGTDFDRLLNVERTDLGGNDPTIDVSNDRLLTFARVDLGGTELGASVLGARQSFDVKSRPKSDAFARSEEHAVSWFGKASAHATILSHLVAGAGAVVELSEAECHPPGESLTALGSMRSADGYVSLDLDAEWMNAYAVATVVDARTTLDRDTNTAPAMEVSDTRFLSQGGARLRIAGPLGLRAGWSQGVYLPTVRDMLDAREALRPETSLSIDAGPSLYRRDSFLELIGFLTWIDDAIEPESLASERLVNISEVTLAGVELTGGMFITDALRVAGALTWTEGRDRASNAPVVTFPTVTGRASVRYDFPVRNAFLEAHLRGTSEPFHVLSVRGADPPASIAGVAPASFARVGMMGGLDLGLGFRLEMTLENVVDTPYRAPTSLVPGAGVDVRAAFSYVWR